MAKHDVFPVTRRGFLAVPAVSAGLAIPGMAKAGSFLDQLASPASPTSLGYWLQSQSVPDLGDVTHTHGARFVDECGVALDAADCTEAKTQPLVSAAALPAGDPGFVAHGARITINGLHTSEHLERLPTLDMFVHGEDGQAFHVFGLKADSVSSPVAFTAPVSPEGGVRLSVRLNGQSRDLDPTAPDFFADHSFVELRLDDRPGMAKLRRGIYLLGWGADPIRADFRGYQMETAGLRVEAPEPEVEAGAGDAPPADIAEPDNRIFTRLVSRRLGGGNAGLAYLTLSVDYRV